MDLEKKKEDDDVYGMCVIPTCRSLPSRTEHESSDDRAKLLGQQPMIQHIKYEGRGIYH
jgi:hypothetical protein